MVPMWFPIFSALLLQANGYAFNPQQLKDASHAVYRGELPFDCPLHQERVSIGHLEDTVDGTIHQKGNFAFDKLPGNLMANLDHVNKITPYKEQIQSSQYYPDYTGYQSQQFNDNFNGYQSQVQSYPSFGNQYDSQPQSYISQPYDPSSYFNNNNYQNNGNDASSSYPYFQNEQNYGNSFNGYDQTAKITPSYNGQSSGDSFSSLPYYGKGENYGNSNNDYEFYGKYSQQNTGDQTFSALPYFESDYKYKDPSYVVGQESAEFNEIEDEDENESEFQNDPNQISQLIKRNLGNLHAIYEGAQEEIAEAKSNIENKSETAKLRIEQLSHGKNTNEGARIESFKRGLFSSFIPKTSRTVFTNSVSNGFNLMNRPLTTITSLRDQVQAALPTNSILTQLTSNIISKSPVNLAQIVKAPTEKELAQPEVERVVLPSEDKSLPKIEEILNKVEEVENENVEAKPEKPDSIGEETESRFEVPEHKSLNVENQKEEKSSETEQPNSPCLAAAAGFELKKKEALEKSLSCIAAANTVADEAIDKADKIITQDYEKAIEEHSDVAEQLKMCANSQFDRCNEEEEALVGTKTHLATKINGELAIVTGAEDVHANTVNACEAEASRILNYLQNSALDSRKNCEEDE